jgi:dual specificity tyrosine-phosphorylation-regulated kinase 1
MASVEKPSAEHPGSQPSAPQPSSAAAAPAAQTLQPPTSDHAGSSRPVGASSRAAAASQMQNGFRATPSASVVTTEPSQFQPMQGRGADRPCVAMSLRLVRFYKKVNERFFSKKRKEGAGPFYNDGYDDRDGHYIVIPGEEIMERYAVQEILGKGSFGTVVKCLDSKRLETVALKITRTGRTFRNQAKQEIDILLKLSRIPGLADSYIARLLKVFEWKGHLCLAFELLSLNLFQLIQCTHFNGVSLDLTRKFAFQVLQVLRALQNHEPPIIHCDIKPENVLLRSNNRSGIRVIDFGSSCYETQRMFRYIQSRFYRSPEVILGLDYTTAIDRWSLGAMLVELHTGVPLFDGRTEAQQLQRMVGLLGPLPYAMVQRATKRDTFFVDGPRSERPKYVESVEPADVQHCETFTDSDGNRVSYWLQLPPAERHIRDLRVVLGVEMGGPSGRRLGQPGHESAVYELFLDFIKGFLELDPVKRLTVDAAMDHPFMLPAIKQQQQQREEMRAAAAAAAATGTATPAIGASSAAAPTAPAPAPPGTHGHA